MTRPFPALMDRVRPRDAIDLMAWPCFSLTRQRRIVPVAYAHRGQSIRVTTMPDGPGLATLHDADILIWAVSHLAEGRDRKLAVSPILSAPAFQILRFLGRDTGRAQYRGLHAALDRLRASEVETNIGVPDHTLVRFHWIQH